MKRKIRTVDEFLSSGCGRCDRFETPECKVHTWQKELQLLREIVLGTGLNEEIKWGQPCYTHNGKNLVIVSALNDFAVISFLKGVLLNDPNEVLSKPGENSQSARMLKFTGVKQIKDSFPTISDFIRQTIALEDSGARVEFKSNPEPIPLELQQMLDSDAALNTAFFALTPGRQRGYILFFSGAKQSATRTSRIKKSVPKILEGKGLNDR
ncbi:MAG: YdeI/OmpD-associated family protein [Pyrinomonadaceae bacterium]